MNVVCADFICNKQQQARKGKEKTGLIQQPDWKYGGYHTSVSV